MGRGGRGLAPPGSPAWGRGEEAADRAPSCMPGPQRLSGEEPAWPSELLTASPGPHLTGTQGPRQPRVFRVREKDLQQWR